jgi:hypothetical protein
MPTKSRSAVNAGDKKYEDFLKGLELVNLGLIRSSSEFNLQEYRRIYREKEHKVRRLISANYELERFEKLFFESSARFSLAMEDEQSNVKIVQIEAVFLGHFHGKPLMEKGLVERFTNSELRLAVWPYFRQFVHDQSARMSIPPILIPLSLD